MPLFVDFIGLNNLVSSSVDTTTNTIETGINTSIKTIATADLQAAINTHRNGPYGWPSWKQIRIGENPVSRYHRANSDLTYFKEPGELYTLGFATQQGGVQITSPNYGTARRSALRSKEEPAVCQMSYPLELNMSYRPVLMNGARGQLVFGTEKVSVGLEQQFFANKSTNDDHNIIKPNIRAPGTPYSVMTSKYLGGVWENGTSPYDSWESLTYKETIFPKPRNMFRKEVRTRQTLPSFFRHNRLDRNQTFLTNSYGFHVFDGQYDLRGVYVSGSHTRALTQSTWPLDVEDHFYYPRFNEITKGADTQFYGGLRPLNRMAGNGGGAQHVVLAKAQGFGGIEGISDTNYFAGASGSKGGAGILMNNYSQLLVNNPVVELSIGDLSLSKAALRFMDKFISPAPYYSRRQTNRFTSSVGNPTGMAIPETASINQHTDASSIKWQAFGLGGALWQAAEQANKKPFYDSYESFSKNIRLIGKNYSVLPEYRISNHLDDLLVGTHYRDIQDILEVTGGQSGKSLSSHEGFYNTYSHSEFMKLFEVIEDDHETFGDFPAPYVGTTKQMYQRLTLRCSVIKKFLPYEGFYPCQRTVQMAEQFYSDCIDFTSIEMAGATAEDVIASLLDHNHNFQFQNLMATLFAPGTLFNTIKAGVACDYPIRSDTNDWASNLLGYGEPMVSQRSYPADYLNPASPQIPDYYLSGEFDKRIPFEALVEPAKYLAGYDIMPSEPHPSGAMSASVLWTGQTKTNKYVMMMNNFLAEVPEFFLQDQKFTMLTSRTSDDPSFGNVVNGRIYGMRIKMYRSMNQARNMVEGKGEVFYNTPQDIVATRTAQDPTTGVNFQQPLRETLTMYSRPTAFGPPSIGFNVLQTSGMTGSVEVKLWENESYGIALTGAATTGKQAPEFHKDSRNGYNFPYTPPYYHGESWIDVYYTASATGKKSVHDIINNLNIEYNRFDYGHYKTYGSTSGEWYGKFAYCFGPQGIKNINRNAMQLSASIDFQTVNSIAGEYQRIVNNQDGTQNVQVVTDNDVGSRWVIQTKFETPILNFNSISVANGTLKLPDNGNNVAASTPRGMWHQYGSIPATQEGVFLEVNDIPSNWTQRISASSPTVYSLADLVGFDSIPRKLGKVATSKIVREAVVAVPYYMVQDQKIYVRLNEPATRAYINSGISSVGFSQNLKDQIDRMRRYVFPPELDFINNDSLLPMAMYIFEFSMEFTQKDLADMWQNLPPDGFCYTGPGENPHTEFETEEQSITHDLNLSEILGGGNGSGMPSPNETHSLHKTLGSLGAGGQSPLRWMVFKVKQRASGYYYDKLASKNIAGPNQTAPGVAPGQRQSTSTNSAIKDMVDAGIQSNWPYDYFSIVELAKLDAEVEFKFDGALPGPTAVLNTEDPEEAPEDLPDGVETAFQAEYDENNATIDDSEVEEVNLSGLPDGATSGGVIPSARWYALYEYPTPVLAAAAGVYTDNAGGLLYGNVSFIDFHQRDLPNGTTIRYTRSEFLGSAQEYQAAMDAYIAHRKSYHMNSGQYAGWQINQAQQAAESNAIDRFRGERTIDGVTYRVIRDRINDDARPGDTTA
tara:strand:+ start:28676 stop:33385 length:4710 start_codon:yes stop_codon:yes gene_type:complete